MTPQTAVQAVIAEWEEHGFATDGQMEYLRKALEAEQAQAVEPVCSQCKGLGYYDEGHENDDGSMSGGNYVDCACNKKDFTQCTTVTNDCLGGCKSLSEHQNYAHPAPPATGERAELIAKYRRLAHAARLRGQSFTPAITKGELLALCDMLEADAKFKPDWVGYRQGVEDGKAKAQQVAAPLTDQQIASIAQQTQSAEPGNDGYILPFTFARAIEAHHGIGAKP